MGAVIGWIYKPRKRTGPNLELGSLPLLTATLKAVPRFSPMIPKQGKAEKDRVYTRSGARETG